MCGRGKGLGACWERAKSEASTDEASLRETFEWCSGEFIRGIIEVVERYGGRASFEAVAEDIKDAAHSPTFDSDGHTALKLFMAEFQELMGGYEVFFDEETTEFFI